jgi:tripartite-type tricarboxylate transporter receptor subunit TctC
MKRRAFIIVSGASAGLFGCPVAAQAWPSKPIRWIVPFAPGGTNDLTARLAAERLNRAFGQPVLVENRVGAGGTIGIEFAAKSAPDGYTILSCSDTIASTPHLYARLGFNPLKDFVAVSQIARLPVVLAVHPSLAVGTLAELVALAKAKPGLGFGSSGTGGQQHIAGEWFAKLAGIKLTHVPYKGGGQAVTDLIGGQVPLASLGALPLIPYHKSGKIKILAQTTRTRSASLPEVPTFVESGYKDLVLEQWQGVFLPARTPTDIVSRLNTEILKSLAEADVRERYAQNGLEVVGSTSQQFAAVVQADYEKYGRLVRELKIKLD